VARNVSWQDYSAVMVSTRSRSAGGESEGGVTAHASQEEVSSSKGVAAASNIKHGAAAPALDPIIEEGVPGSQSQQAPQTSQRRRRVLQQQQSQEEKEVVQQQDTQQQPQDTQQHPFQEQPEQRSQADVFSSDDADSDLDFDGPGVLQNLAAALQSGFRSQSQQPPQQQRFQGLRAAAAADKQQELDDAQLQQLRWRPHTGLQLPAKAAAAVSLVRPRQSKKSQQQDEPLGALVDTAAEAQATAQQAADVAGAAAAAATKQPGLSKALHAPTLDAAARTKEAKKAAPDTAGSKWFDLPAPKVTDELKRDLRLLRLRGAYDPKRFYKSFDNSKFPKYFAVRQYTHPHSSRGRLVQYVCFVTATGRVLHSSLCEQVLQEPYAPPHRTSHSPCGFLVMNEAVTQRARAGRGSRRTQQQEQQLGGSGHHTGMQERHSGLTGKHTEVSAVWRHTSSGVYAFHPIHRDGPQSAQRVALHDTSYMTLLT